MDRLEHLKLALDNTKSHETLLLDRIKNNVQIASNLTFLQNYLLLNALTEAFLKNKSFLQECYDNFFPDLMEHAKGINTLLQLEN